MPSSTRLTGHGDELARDAPEIACDEGEEVTGLLERIAPDREMSPRTRLARGFQVAVGEQDGRFGLVGLEPHAIDREHVGPIEEIGDAAEPFGLALRAIGRPGAVEPHQLGVGGGVQPGFDPQRERTPGRIGEPQRRGRRIVGGGLQRLAVEAERRQREFVAVQFQRRVDAPLRMRPQRQRRDDAGDASIERNIEIDRIDQEVGDAIIGEADGLSNMRAHRGGLSIRAPLPASCGEGPGWVLPGPRPPHP